MFGDLEMLARVIKINTAQDTLHLTPPQLTLASDQDLDCLRGVSRTVGHRNKVSSTKAI